MPKHSTTTISIQVNQQILAYAKQNLAKYYLSVAEYLRKCIEFTAKHPKAAIQYFKECQKHPVRFIIISVKHYHNHIQYQVLSEKSYQAASLYQIMKDQVHCWHTWRQLKQINQQNPELNIFNHKLIPVNQDLKQYIDQYTKQSQPSD